MAKLIIRVVRDVLRHVTIKNFKSCDIRCVPSAKDWPGLSARALYQGRDLAATLDLRSVLKGILSEHLAVPAGALEQAVFPDSSSARPLRGLMRA